VGEQNQLHMEVVIHKNPYSVVIFHKTYSTVFHFQLVHVLCPLTQVYQVANTSSLS
jgi:hypothetical protein